MKYCVVGSGVTGLATGNALLEQGHEVHFTDINAEALKNVPDRAGVTASVPVPSGMDGYFVCVSAGTLDWGFDSFNLLAATKSIGQALAVTPKFPIVVFRCTQPPGTTRNTLIPILAKESGKSVNNGFGVCYWPEYLRAWNAVNDALHPRQIIFSSPQKHDDSQAALLPLLLTFGAPLAWVELEAAEYQKYIHNVYNAMKISAFNWFRILGEKIGLKPEEVNDIIHLTVRSAEGLWNPEYGTRDLGPYDGACLPKDTKMLRIYADTAGVDNSLLVAVEKVNKDAQCRQQQSNG